MSRFATSLAKSKLLRARTLYRMMAQKLAALNSPLILRDMASPSKRWKNEKDEVRWTHRWKR